MSTVYVGVIDESAASEAASLYEEALPLVKSNAERQMVLNFLAHALWRSRSRSSEAVPIFEELVAASPPRSTQRTEMKMHLCNLFVAIARFDSALSVCADAATELAPAT